MAHSQYQVEVKKQGALVCRTESSDCVELTKRIALTLSESMGESFTVTIVRDHVTFHAYEWDAL